MHVFFSWWDEKSEALKGELTCLSYHMGLEFKSKETGHRVHGLNHHFVLYACLGGCVYTYMSYSVHECMCASLSRSILDRWTGSAVCEYAHTQVVLKNAYTHFALQKKMQFPFNNRLTY